MTKKQINKIGYATAIITFGIATLIMIGDIFGFKGDFERWGIKFIPIAFIVNVFVIITMFVLASIYKIKGYFKSINYMLYNIPVAILYIFLAIWIMSFYRITLVNDTDYIITDIRMYGCDTVILKKLEPGKRENFWINIPNDCSIKIQYRDRRGDIQDDVVIGYLSSFSGGTDKYYFSGVNNPKY